MWKVLFIVQIACAYNPIINTFEDHETVLNHLVVNYKTGSVYVGAVNKMYQLSSNLNLVQNVVTGPVNDSTLCSFECVDIAMKLTDNFNKVLVIDYVHNRLITCGSVLQGMCSVRSLSNIYIARDIPTAVAANDPTASTVAFLAPGPPNPTNTQVMYTGVTFTGSFGHRYKVPAVSSLSLEEHRLFDIAKTYCDFCHSDQVTGTRLFINTMYRDQYIVNYVYGFSSGAFSYFLTTQQRPGGGYYSKIIRICHNDELYNSYTEIPLSCKQNGDVDYNIVEAGFFSKPTHNLTNSVGISIDQDVLYTLFRRDENPLKSNSKISALCVYTVREINKKIGDNVEKCFEGEGMRGLEYVWPNRKCVKHKLDTKGADYCGSNVNSPLGGELPIETRPLTEFNDTLTALAVTVTHTNTRLIIGTSQGHLKIIMSKNSTSIFEYGEIILDEGSPVNKDLVFDTQQRYIYAMTGKKIFKVQVYQCHEHTSCSSCVDAGNPYNYCGWCLTMNKCCPRSDCKDALGKPLFWLPNGYGPCTVDDETKPIQIQHESIVSKFTDPVSERNSLFNHLVVDRQKDHVYIGAVNRIYHMSPDLKLMQWVVTGPVNEFEYCSSDCPANILKNISDNINKVLQIDNTRTRLITCGSILQGTCSVRSLYNISNDMREVHEPMGMLADIGFSPVAFLATISLSPLSTQVMYLGSLSSSASKYPVVSSRSLEDHDLFKVSYKGLNTATTIYSDHFESENNYGHTYVYGFSSGRFSYFLRAQGSGSGRRYTSSIVRICLQYDRYTYIEMPISCEVMTNDGKRSYSYNYMVAAFVGKPGNILAEQLEITVNDDVLFAVFLQRPRSSSSVLCLYPLKMINKKFWQNIKLHFSKLESRGLDCSSSSGSCNAINLESITEDFCGLNIDMPLWGKESIVALAGNAFIAQATAVTSTTFGKYTVVFMGTAQGHLMKILIESAISISKLDDIGVGDSSPVNKDLFFDKQLRHLYVMTKHNVFKVKVHQCNDYKSCLNCLKANEVYCGWCVIENKCSVSSDCVDADMGSSYWLPRDSGQCNIDAQKPIQILSSAQSMMPTFTDPAPEISSRFNHLVVDRNTGLAYVGAVNRIYQLSADLEVTQRLITGPLNDSYYCSPDCPDEHLKHLTDNFNIVLLIDYASSRLIICGSVSQGICSARDLFNISKNVSEVNEPVVFHEEGHSPVAFIAPDPAKPPISTKIMRLIYLGVESLDESFPVVSSRSLEDQDLLKVSYNGLNTNTTVFFDHFSSERDNNRFVYGFSSGGFNYFIRMGTRGEAGSLRIYFSKIISVCYEGNHYSYTEIPISCKKIRNDGKVTHSFNHVVAASVHKPGSVLAKKLGITVDDDVLFAAFHSSPQLVSSALCIYPLKKIREVFSRNIHTYFNTTQSFKEDFCGPDINTPIWGQDPVETVPVVILKTRLTALAATVTGDHTVVFAGTEQGRLKKIVVRNAMSAFEYGDVVVDEDSPVNKDMVFDRDQTNLYVMTERKVSKVKVQHCSDYKSYIDCVGSRDPYCEWCLYEEKCDLQTLCE